MQAGVPWAAGFRGGDVLREQDGDEAAEPNCADRGSGGNCGGHRVGGGGDVASGVGSNDGSVGSASDGGIGGRWVVWVSDQGLLPLARGAQLNEHDEVRTGKGSH